MLTMITALLCEAKPLISKYKLKKISGTHAYPIYRNNEISLIVSGVGKAASASAIGYAHATNGSPAYSAWLNIGMAGHSTLDIGTGFLANKIKDQSTGETWFPPVIFNLPCLGDQLITVDQPDNQYQQPGGVDMEAASFYAIAHRFTTSELVQCYKVVSDNPQTPVGPSIKRISTNEATDLIAGNMEDIDFLIGQLLNNSHELSIQHKLPLLFNEINDQVKLTHSEQLLIKESLRKLHLLNPKALPHVDQLKKPASATFVLNILDQLIKEQAINFQP